MPTYCYTDEKAGRTIEIIGSMFKSQPRSIRRGGVVFKRDRDAEWSKRSVRSRTKGWPIECYASGVNANQADDLREHFRKEGLNVEVSKDGNPIYSDMTQRRKALKSRGLVDKDSYI